MIIGKTLNNNEAAIFRYILYLLQAFILCFIGFKYHLIEDWQGENPELDFYMRRASNLASLKFKADPYRPQGYIILVSFLSILVGNVFAAGKIISIASGIWFYIISGKIANILFGRRAETSILLILLGSPFLVITGVRTSTDMLYWTLISSFLYLWSKRIIIASNMAGINDYAALGALFGAAFGTRYTAISIIPALALYTIFYASANHSRISSYCHSASAMTSIIKNSTGLCFGAVIGFSPSGIINIITTGRFFYTDNWKNVLLSLCSFQENLCASGNPHSFVFNRAIKDDLYNIILSHPDIFLGKIIHEMAGFISGLPSEISLSPGILIIFTTTSFGCIIAFFMRFIRKPNEYLLHFFYIATATSILAVNSATFFSYTRFTLLTTVIIAIYYCGAISFCKRNLWLMLIIFTLSAQAPLKISGLLDYSKHHQISNINALNTLENMMIGTKDNSVTILGTNIFLGYRTKLNYLHYAPLELLSNKKSRDAYCDGLKDKAEEINANVLLIGTISSYGFPTPDCQQIEKSESWTAIYFEGINESTRLLFRK